MATKFDSSIATQEDSDAIDVQHSGVTTAAFPMLSRDRLIRRVISPRLWKHFAVAVFLILTPIIYAFVTWPSASGTHSSESVLFRSRLNGLRGLSGLNLLAAGQFCLLIAWVRAASPVDFRGRFRWWRWLAMVLFAGAVAILTGTTDWITNLLAQGLEPLFGPIDAARPALIFIPASACIALILRHVIPDMGRCRSSQFLIIMSTVLLAVRSFAAARQQSIDAVFHLATLDLLISGLVLSAVQLHARFVIHVNPNPPLAAERKSPVRQVPIAVDQTAAPSLATATETLLESRAPLELPAGAGDNATVSESASAELLRLTGLQAPPEANHCEDGHGDPHCENSGLQTQSGQDPVEPALKASATRTDAGQSQTSRNKSGKKQKFRKAG